tara:strand:- start:27 stop:386 length:360 start_codon:yes stop_codon:yes gene_type:complete
MRKNFINITLFVLTTLGTLLTIEVVMCLFIFKPKSILPNGLLTQSSISLLTPGFKGKFNNNEISSEISINSKGLRDKEVYYTKKNKEFRIIFPSFSLIFFLEILLPVFIYGIINSEKLL